MLRRDGYLHPFLLQALGIVLLLGFVAIWIFTGKQSGLLVGAALTLTAMGSASGAIITVRQEIQEHRDEEESVSRKRKPPRPRSDSSKRRDG